MLTSDISSAIIKAVKDLGNDILKSPTIVSILSDYHAFDVHDPLLKEKKDVIALLVSEGYSDSLNQWLQKSDNTWKSEDIQWIEQFCNKTGQKRHLVGMLTDAMKMAIGLDATFDDFSDTKKMLNTAIREYKSALERLIDNYSDCLGLKNAFYPISANTELYRLEGRIKILSFASNLSQYDARWFDLCRNNVIVNHSDSRQKKEQIASECIASDYTQYTQILYQQINLGEQGCEFFDEEIVKQLDEIAQRLNLAYKICGQSKRIDVSCDIAESKEKVNKYLHQLVFDDKLSSYQKALESSIVVDIDVLGLKTARIDTSKEDVKRFEQELLEYASTYFNELKTPGYMPKWVELEKARLILLSSTKENEKRQIARNVLSKEGSEYADIIKEQLGFGKKHGKCFEDTAKIIALSERLNRAFEIIGDNQRVDVNKDIIDAKAAVKKYRRTKFAIITLIVLILGFFAVVFIRDRIEYNKHRAEIEAFEGSMANGDKLLETGEKIEALSEYINAEKEYTADYRIVHYKSIAQKKQNAVSYLILSSDSATIDSLLYIGKCKEAKIQYDSLLTKGLTIDFSEYSKFFEDALVKGVNLQRDLILTNISKQKGKASKTNLEELDDLLYCMPDDYYLNLIKSKIK